MCIHSFSLYHKCASFLLHYKKWNLPLPTILCYLFVFSKFQLQIFAYPIYYIFFEMLNMSSKLTAFPKTLLYCRIILNHPRQTGLTSQCKCPTEQVNYREDPKNEHVKNLPNFGPCLYFFLFFNNFYSCFDFYRIIMPILVHEPKLKWFISHSQALFYSSANLWPNTCSIKSTPHSSQ